MMDIEKLHNILNQTSSELGFSDYSATPLTPLQTEMTRFKDYLLLNFNADMSYLEKNCEIRENPERLLNGAKSVMCFLANYKTDFKQNYILPQIASYAYGADYHKVIRDKLYLLVDKMKEFYPENKFRVFTDSAPILEKEWASRAGLGFIGKNTMLISKRYGVKTFIGVILTDLVVKYSSRIEKTSCGSCNKCIDACPTGALVREYVIDARKCISYQTIESKREIGTEPFRIDFNNYIFGCDICIDACPWSAKGGYTTITEFFPDVRKMNNTQEDWSSMSQSEFLEQYNGSPLARAGLKKINDNILCNGVKN